MRLLETDMKEETKMVEIIRNRYEGGNQNEEIMRDKCRNIFDDTNRYERWNSVDSNWNSYNKYY